MSLFRVAGVGVLVLSISSGIAFSEQIVDVNIGLATTGFASAAAPLSKELGLYEKHGLKPNFVVMENASTTTTAVISGSVPIGLSGPGELVVAQSKGIDLVVISNAYGGMGGVLTLSNAAAQKTGVSLDAPAPDRLRVLDGLLIAAPSATSVWTLSYKLAAENVGASIRFTYMAPATMQAAMEAGSIDGYIAGAPYWAAPLMKDTGVTWISGPKGEVPAEFSPASSADYQAMRSFAEANPKIVEGIVAAHNDLADVIRTRPADVIAALRTLYPQLDEDTLELLFNTEKLAWMAPQLTAGDMEHEIAFIDLMGKLGANASDLDPARMLFP